MRTAFVIAAALLSTGASAADDTAAAKLVAAAEAGDGAYRLVQSLTTEVGPRLCGTEAEGRARDWGVRALKAAGFRNVRIENFTTRRWERISESASVVTPGAQPLVIAALGRSVPTPAAGITARVVRAASVDELKKMPPGSLDGAIAFVDGATFKGTRDGDGYSSARRGAGAIEAARRGAIAVLIRSQGSSTHRFAHTGILRYADDVPKIPAAALANADADQLARLLEAGPVTVRLRIETETTENAPSGNVVGEIPGSDKAKEIVLLGAHLDSWDQGTGAIDDGVGVGMVIEAARVAAATAKPRRTLRVVLFGCEETNLAGAAAYAKAHKDERHVLMTESDYGTGRVWGFYTRVPEPMLPVMDRFAADLAPLGVERGHNKSSGGEDLEFLREQGVPLVSLVQDATTYFDYHHTQDDTFDKVDAAALRQNVAAFGLFAWRASTLDRLSGE